MFFLSDHNGVANVWVMGLDGAYPTQLTRECGMDVMEFDIDGDDVVYRVGAGLKKFSVVAGGDAVGGGPVMKIARGQKALLGTPVQISLVSEFKHASVRNLPDPMLDLQEAALSFTGEHAALVIRGQIFYAPLHPELGTRVEKVTSNDGAVRYKHAQFVRNTDARDNVRIIAMSDASGEYEYVLLERGGGGGGGGGGSSASTLGGPWSETQITVGGTIRGVMSHSDVSPDLSTLVYDDTSGAITALNLNATAANSYDFKTRDAPVDDDSAYEDGDGAANATAAGGGMLGPGMMPIVIAAPGAGGGGGAASPFTAGRGPGGARRGRRRRAGGFPSSSSSSSSRAVSSLGFRRDHELTRHLSSGGGGASASATRPRPRARDMHHGRLGRAPPSGGFDALFTSSRAGLGADSDQPAPPPPPGDGTGIARPRNVMSGLRPRAAGEYAWSPDSAWLAFVASDDTEFSSVYVWNVAENNVTRVTENSYNAAEPTFTPDGLFLYYLSDAAIESGSASPYGARGSEPNVQNEQRLMCLPLRAGFACPFHGGDELNPHGGVAFDPSIGARFKTKIHFPGIEKRAVAAPFVPKRAYAGLKVLGDGRTFIAETKARSIHWSPYDRVGVVNAVP